MNKAVVLGLIAAVVVIAAAWWFVAGPDRTSPADPLPTPTESSAQDDALPETGSVDDPQYPLPDVTAEPEVADVPPVEAPPMPPLGGSDEEVLQASTQAAGNRPIEAFLVPDNVVRRFVATVDNLAGDKLSMKSRAVPRIDGRLAVVDSGEGRYVLAEENYSRYEPFVDTFTGVDAQAFAAVYQRYYPLFQEAYAELGYPDRYFNDRVVQVIDHLLETPEVARPIELVRPKVFYQFADPQLEALSSGQKALIRMGPENAQAVKERLREIRAQITSNPPAR